MQYFGFDRPSFGIKTFGFGESEFSPLELFAGGKQGVWYDPSDKSTLFQNVGGASLPVTKDGDPVGLMLDKSQGLEGAVTNVAKPFMADSSDSLLEVTNTSDGTKLVIKQLTTASRLNIFELDKTYKLSVVYSIPESSDDINAYNTGAGVSNFLFTATKGVRNKAEVTLTAKSLALYFRAYSGEITIHEVVLKEIKGNHATQSVSTSRPIYKTDGVLHWLQFDGVDDWFDILSMDFLGGNIVSSASIRPMEVTQYNRTLLSQFGSRKSLLWYLGATTIKLYTISGEVSQSASTPTGEDRVVGARNTQAGNYKGCRVDGSPLSASVGFDATTSSVPATAMLGSAEGYLYRFGGRLYGIAAAFNDDAVEHIGAMDLYMANKAGVTL